jgi:hypothetical protein
MNREYLVSLDISSDALSLSELSIQLGSAGSKRSHDKDDFRRTNDRVNRRNKIDDVRDAAHHAVAARCIGAGILRVVIAPPRCRSYRRMGSNRWKY